MAHNKKAFEELYKGNRSFSVISSVLAYFSQQTTETAIDQLQKEEWNSILSNDQTTKAELEHVLYKLKYQILLEKTQRQKRLMIRISQIAAVLILPLIFLFLIQYNYSKSGTDKQLHLIELYCPEGARTKFTLPDGSSGWLAGGSVISYTSNFEENREVSVEGEAFFNVKHDKKHLFTVKLDDLVLKDLGTEFNVLNDPEEPICEVVVLSGLVEVQGKKFSGQLSANKKLQLQKEENKIYLSDVDAKSYTAWIEGRLEFNNEHIESVCRKIERFYDVDVELNIKGLENNVFRANVKIGSLEELLNYMSLALPIKYELINAKKSNDGKIERRKLIISKK